MLGVPGVDDSFFAMLTQPPKTIRVGELRLSGEARINQFEAKAGFRVANDYDALDGDVGPDVKGVAPGDVIDLTRKLQPDGRLDWTPPPGRFKVIRFGASLTGKSNHPATEEATGLEVDKYDGAAVRRYLETYLDMYVGATGPELFGKKGLRALMVDSIEVGASNWTRELVARFKSLRGYDPTPWFPTLTGVIVGSRAESDAFLFDFRRTLADLIASEHYGTVAKVAHERGLIVYGEALENGRPSLGDDMAMRAHNDIPMAALWTYRPEAGSQCRLLPGPEGRGLGRAPLRPGAGGGRVDDVGHVALGACPGRPAARHRPRVRLRHQPARHPHLGPPAGRRQAARAVADDLRPVLQPPRDLGGDGAALDRLPLAQQPDAPAGALLRRRRLLLRRGGPLDRPLQQQADRRRAAALRLRLHQRGRAP